MPDAQFVSIERDQFTGGIKASPITNTFGLALGGGPLTTTDEAYQTVPWLYRAAQLRAATLSRMPFGIEDIESGEDVDEDDPRVTNITKWMTRSLFLAELSRVLYGAAYFLLESNRFGLNTTPRYIPRIYVTPQTDMVQGVTGFGVTFVKDTVPLNKMVYIWEPNPASEIAPGPAPAYVALQAAGMLGALDQMTTQYFRGGAVPLTVVEVPASVSPDERNKLENWFVRFAAGIRNAWKFMPVTVGTKFTKIGSEIKDTTAPDLTAAQRDNVAVALGVPPSVIDGKSANYATANSEMMGFYLHTVIPSAELIAEAFNVQLFQRAGLRFYFDIDDLEIMQTAQLEQAKSLQDLTGGKAVLSVNEAREILDYDPVPGGDWKEDEPAPAPPPAFGASAASPAQPQTDAAGTRPEDLEADDPEEQMKRWLAYSLDLHRAASPATVGAPFDSELAAASSANMIKRIYAAHWPKQQPAPAESWQAQAVRELARFNALAEGVSDNG